MKKIVSVIAASVMLSGFVCAGISISYADSFGITASAAGGIDINDTRRNRRNDI